MAPTEVEGEIIQYLATAGPIGVRRSRCDMEGTIGTKPAAVRPGTSQAVERGLVEAMRSRRRGLGVAVRKK